MAASLVNLFLSLNILRVLSLTKLMSLNFLGFLKMIYTV